MTDTTDISTENLERILNTPRHEPVLFDAAFTYKLIAEVMKLRYERNNLLHVERLASAIVLLHDYPADFDAERFAQVKAMKEIAGRLREAITERGMRAGKEEIDQ